MEQYELANVVLKFCVNKRNDILLLLPPLLLLLPLPPPLLCTRLIAFFQDSLGKPAPER